MQTPAPDLYEPTRNKDCCYALQEVEYIVKNSAKWRESISILSKVSGSIHPGDLTALVRILTSKCIMTRHMLSRPAACNSMAQQTVCMSLS